VAASLLNYLLIHLLIYVDMLVPANHNNTLQSTAHHVRDWILHK